MTSKQPTKTTLLKALYAHYPTCKSLPIDSLDASRIVYGEGNPDAEIMLIGEAPGLKEDQLGKPFVGRSGQLLTKTLQSVGIQRENIFITNVVKCRPPNNRTPTRKEILAYKQLLLIPEITIIQPKIIITLGSTALKALIDDNKQEITKMRGTLHTFNGIPLIPTYHPAYILRNPKELETLRNDIAFAVSLLK